MSEPMVDLTNCDRELIHIPGEIQSHGFLIVLDDKNTIQFFSANISEYVKNIPENIIGQPFQVIKSFFKTEQENLIQSIIAGERHKVRFDELNPIKIDIDSIPFFLIISLSDKYLLLEFEKVSTRQQLLNIQKTISFSIAQILINKKLQSLLENAAAQVKLITQFDRVMIYRFAKDGHGEVVAESKNDNLEPWFGLHYPASDIPKQARELYKINHTRLIADVESISSKIITSATNNEPLDLTFSQLRAVSPIHIQYLKNMGVASSFSISLICEDELWGLIACHNYTPRFINYALRESAKLIGQILSSTLEFKQHEENLELREHYKNQLELLSRQLQKKSIIDALTTELTTMLNIVSAIG